MKTLIQTLRDEIKTSAARTRRLRNRAHERHDEEWAPDLGWSSLADLNRELQARLDEARDPDQRHRLLAYGYLRGRAYHSIERTCRVRPCSQAVAAMARVPEGELERWLRPAPAAPPCPDLAFVLSPFSPQ